MADTHIDTEVYKPIRGYDGKYMVTSLGRVYSQKNNMFLAAGKNERGYLHVSLYINGKKKTTLVHKLVAEAFLEKPGEKLQVDHIDQVKTNNAAWNLRYCTSRANMLNIGVKRNNSSGFIGVTWHQRDKRWQASTSVEGKNTYLGIFQDAETAARIRDVAAWFTSTPEEREFLVMNFDWPFATHGHVVDDDTQCQEEEDIDLVEVSAYDAEDDGVPPFFDMRTNNSGLEVELT